MFDAHCVSLEWALRTFLTNKNYTRKIDLLSVDIEHGEPEIFKNFPFHNFPPISVVVIELRRGTIWEMDLIMGAREYVKVAMLGWSSPLETSVVLKSSPLETSVLFGSSPLETSVVLTSSPLVSSVVLGQDAVYVLNSQMKYVTLPLKFPTKIRQKGPTKLHSKRVE